MRRLFRTALMVILFAARAAVATVSEGSSGELRDIRGTIPPSGLPPFMATTALFLLAAAGVTITRFNRSRSSETLPDPASGTPVAELLSLRPVQSDAINWSFTVRRYKHETLGRRHRFPSGRTLNL